MLVSGRSSSGFARRLGSIGLQTDYNALRSQREPRPEIDARSRPLPARRPTPSSRRGGPETRAGSRFGRPGALRAPTSRDRPSRQVPRAPRALRQDIYHRPGPRWSRSSRSRQAPTLRGGRYPRTTVQDPTVPGDILSNFRIRQGAKGLFHNCGREHDLERGVSQEALNNAARRSLRADDGADVDVGVQHDSEHALLRLDSRFPAPFPGPGLRFKDRSVAVFSVRPPPPFCSVMKSSACRRANRRIWSSRSTGTRAAKALPFRSMTELVSSERNPVEEVADSLPNVDCGDFLLTSRNSSNDLCLLWIRHTTRS